MNHPFIKMLKFEWKSNYMMWIFYAILFFFLITFFSYHSRTYPFYDGKYLPLIALFTFVFTIYSYQESVRPQTMQMYHLIPVSRNIKFFSKQFITLIGFPLILCLLILISTSVLAFVTDQPPGLGRVRISIANQLSILSQIILLIVGHSVSTFFAIFFKKNKIRYAILSYIGLRIGLGGILLVIFYLTGIKDTSINLFSLTSYPPCDFNVIGLIILSVVFYVFSYHRFLRRQL